MTKININNPFKEPVYYKENTDSTMIDIASITDSGHGTIVMAAFQKRGRGRGSERTWESPKGQNLLFSISLVPEEIVHPFLRVPLIAGLALTEYLNERHKLNARLKWPNDVLVNEKKIAGILCEYRKDRLLLGMGINCEQTEFSPDIKEKTTSLFLSGIASCRPVDILEGFLIYLEKRLIKSEWKEKALSLLYRKNEEVMVCEGAAEDEKITRLKIEGLDDDGCLVAREIPGNIIRHISTGEIRFTAQNKIS